MKKNHPPSIDCSDNPLDLRPAVDALEKRIREHAVNDPDNPLIVIMGENHTIPTHVALQQALMARLSDPNNPHGPRLRIAGSVELPHNMIDNILGEQKPGSVEVPADIRAPIAAEPNPDKRFYLAYQTALSQDPNRAPYTHRNAIAWAEKNGVSIRPTEPAWQPTEKNYDLDRTDRITDETIKREAPGHVSGVAPEISDTSQPQEQDATNAFYMRIRNVVAHDQVYAHIDKEKPNVYFMFSGQSHVLGIKPKKGSAINAPYEDSLNNLFVKDGKPTLPVLLIQSDDDLKELPAGAHEALKNGVYIKGLSPRRFINEVSTDAERTFLEEGINRNSGNDALELFPDKGTRATFGYGPNHKFVQEISLIPVPRPSSRERIPPVVAVDLPTEIIAATSKETDRGKEGKSRGRDSMTQKVKTTPTPPV